MVAVDPDASRLQAVATTRIRRFKDDVVWRVRPDPADAGACLVDGRSRSRVGKGDFGANAGRLREFLGRLRADVGSSGGGGSGARM